ncbi:hypothetical protein NDU88_005972 [Pleurodeles waltl]|uniref:Uncharacterized protein n=1 Tax=Pleurodeles waltl TaxID=8319 RepID=A0AAV7TWA9_PLEWA|nr:hypothetical protein NDU88_005972 [Pleurodeles waltl]
MGPRRDKSATAQSKRAGGHCRSQALWHQTEVATKTEYCLQQEGGRSPLTNTEPWPSRSPRPRPAAKWPRGSPAVQHRPPRQPGSLQCLSAPITGARQIQQEGSRSPQFQLWWHATKEPAGAAKAQATRARQPGPKMGLATDVLDQCGCKEKHQPVASPGLPMSSQAVKAGGEATEKEKCHVLDPPPAEPHSVVLILQDGQAMPPRKNP